MTDTYEIELNSSQLGVILESLDDARENASGSHERCAVDHVFDEIFDQM